MDTSFQSDFSYCAELWRFIRSRFAFQAKQIKKVTSQPLAQCYELVAASHGFTSWRGLSKTLNAMAVIDSLVCEDSLTAALEGRPEGIQAARLALTVGQRQDEIFLDYDEVDWACLERSIGRPPTLVDINEIALVKALTFAETLRTHLFYKGAWLGQGAPWSDDLLNEFYTCQNRLGEIFGKDDPRLYKTAKAIFGRGHLDQSFDWQTSSYTVKDYNANVALILNSKVAGVTDGPFKEVEAIYQLGREPNRVRVEDLRRMMGFVHSGALDRCTNDSFLIALLLCSRPCQTPPTRMNISPAGHCLIPELPI